MHLSWVLLVATSGCQSGPRNFIQLQQVKSLSMKWQSSWPVQTMGFYHSYFVFWNTGPDFGPTFILPKNQFPENYEETA